MSNKLKAASKAFLDKLKQLDPDGDPAPPKQSSPCPPPRELSEEELEIKALHGGVVDFSTLVAVNGLSCYGEFVIPDDTPLHVVFDFIKTTSLRITPDFSEYNAWIDHDGVNVQLFLGGGRASQYIIFLHAMEIAEEPGSKLEYAKRAKKVFDMIGDVITRDWNLFLKGLR